MKCILQLLCCVLLMLGCVNKSDSNWRNYGGNKAGNRYSSLKEINTDNVKNLKIAWMYDTAEDSAHNILGKRE